LLDALRASHHAKLGVTNRLAAIDALRGLTVLTWLLSNVAAPVLSQMAPGSWTETLANQLAPSVWDGVTIDDFIVPMFLFLAGASIVPAFRTGQAAGRSFRQSFWRIVRRLALLFAIGILFEGGLRFATRWWPHST
jgi:predicted acyltransferase